MKSIEIIDNKSDIGLSNVDNTADADKPISKSVKTELDKIILEIKGFKSITLEDGFVFKEGTDNVVILDEFAIAAIVAKFMREAKGYKGNGKQVWCDDFTWRTK